MRLTLKEGLSDKYVYHNSPDPNIEIFTPREFWRSEDWSQSEKTERPGYKKESVIFAIDKDRVPFYSVPRDTPRILLNEYHEEAKKILGLKGNNIFLLPEQEKNDIENHSWTQYIFDKKDFKKIPTQEWVADKPVKPIKKVEHRNPIPYLEKNGYKILWVKDVLKIAKMLMDEGVPFNGENVGT